MTPAAPLPPAGNDGKEQSGPAVAGRPDLLRGLALVLPDDASADLLHPPRHYSLDRDRVAQGAFAGLPGVAAAMETSPGQTWIVVAGRDLGAGSSRETTLYALRDRGIAACVAASTGSIFQRNAWNCGVPVVEVAGPSEVLATGDPVELDLAEGWLRGRDRTWRGEAPGPYFLALWRAGGLFPLLRHRGLLP